MISETAIIRTGSQAIIATLLLAVFVVGCSQDTKTAADTAPLEAQPPQCWSELREGMTMVEVETLLGKPQQNELLTIHTTGYSDDRHVERLAYDYYEPLWIFSFGSVRFSVANTVIDWQLGCFEFVANDAPYPWQSVDHNPDAPVTKSARNLDQEVP